MEENHEGAKEEDEEEEEMRKKMCKLPEKNLKT